MKIIEKFLQETLQRKTRAAGVLHQDNMIFLVEERSQYGSLWSLPKWTGDMYTKPSELLLKGFKEELNINIIDYKSIVEKETMQVIDQEEAFLKQVIFDVQKYTGNPELKNKKRFSKFGWFTAHDISKLKKVTGITRMYLDVAKTKSF